MIAWWHKDQFRPLRRSIGAEKLLSAAEDLVLYGFDATNYSGIPLAVVFPESGEDVQETVRFAVKSGLHITPRGAGTGLSGGSVPVNGGIVLSCERMKKIISLDPTARTAIVEPGVVTSILQEMVAKVGLYYPPDPSSYSVSTIGGNVAENAGGLHCFKYGVTGHYVLGLDFVNAAGDLVSTGVLDRQRLNPDLTPLMVGSEGTLGIITRIALRLIPVPEMTVTVAAFFRTDNEALTLVEQIIARRYVPSVLEYIGTLALKASTMHTGVTYPEGTGAMLLIELDGDRDQVPAMLNEVGGLIRGGALEIQIAEGREERERLWMLRRGIAPSLIRLGPGKTQQDVAVPRGSVSKLAEIIDGISAEFELKVAVFGHAGDGNLHVVLLYDQLNQEQSNRARDAVAALFKSTLELGGTITGEHGIGIAKKEFLPLQQPEAVRSLYHKFKTHFDPEGIFNPGKILN